MRLENMAQMEIDQDFDIIVGAETGLLKGVNLSADKKSWSNLNTIESARREKEITCLCWRDDEQTEFCAGLRDRTVVVYDQRQKQISNSYDDTGGNGVLKAIATLNESIITCTDKGDLTVTTHGKTMTQLSVGENLCCMRQNPWQRHLVATGGKENALKIWDLENPQEPIFKSKNVRNDWLNLRVPIWVTDAAFLPNSEKIVTCTGHHQVRIYDPSSPQKRPVMEVEIDEYPLISMSLRQGYDQVVVGNTHGLMTLVDFRGKAYQAQKYRGFAGGIRSIQCHPHNGTVTSCGLDRFLRVHDIDSRELLHKVYLKSRLNCLLLADDWDRQSDLGQLKEIGKSQKQKPSQEGEQNDAGEVDEIWEKMAVVGKNKNEHEVQRAVEEMYGEFSDDQRDDRAKDDEEHKKPVKRVKSSQQKDSKKRKKLKT